MSTSCNYSIIINNHSAINVLHRHFGYNVAFHDVFTIKLIIRGFRGVLGDPKNKNYRLLLKSFHAFVHCSSPVRTLDSGRLGLSPFIHFFASPIWSIRPLLVTILRKPCLARTFYFTFGVWSSLFVGLRPFSSRNVNFSPPPPPPPLLSVGFGGLHRGRMASALRPPLDTALLVPANNKDYIVIYMCVVVAFFVPRILQLVWTFLSWTWVHRRSILSILKTTSRSHQSIFINYWVQGEYLATTWKCFSSCSDSKLFQHKHKTSSHIRTPQ